MAGLLILNQQDKYNVRSSRLAPFLRDLRRALRLGRLACHVCLVDDRQIKRLNSFYRGQHGSTDVLSFPWNPRPASLGRAARGKPALRREAARRHGPQPAPEFRDFLGDIVISTQTARRNAQREGHSTLNEIRWLILHGLLHLLGYDHECDKGEMTRLELSLRQRLGIG
jgi:probable rRNA maturation factor